MILIHHNCYLLFVEKEFLRKKQSRHIFSCFLLSKHNNQHPKPKGSEKIYFTSQFIKSSVHAQVAKAGVQANDMMGVALIISLLAWIFSQDQGFLRYSGTFQCPWSSPVYLASFLYSQPGFKHVIFFLSLPPMCW